VNGHVSEIMISCEHGQIVTNAQLGEKSIDRSDPDAAPSAAISQFRRSNVTSAELFCLVSTQ
jgi:hypothetical protein